MAFVKLLKLASGVLTQHNDTADDLKVNVLETVSNLTVGGDLTVNGTTTTINTTTLDVEDTNITVNKGGNDASSEGAGLTVERVSTDGSLIYADAAATKFKIGALAAEVEIADISTVQTLTNKTISGSTNTITNLSATNITSGTLADGRLSSNVVLLTASQTLTNKTLDGDSNTLSLETGAGSPNGSVSGVVGELFHDTTGDDVYVNTDGATAWQLVGGASIGDITSVTAGSGLTGGGTSGAVTLDVGAGDGISVAADSIAVDATVLRTTGSQSITADTKTFATGSALTMASGSTLSVSGTFNVQGSATGITGTELETLSDGSNADSLHTHSSVDAARIVKTLTAGTGGIAAGDAVYVSANDTILKADSDALGTARFAGIAPSAITASASGTVVTQGVVTGVLTGATAGNPVYLSATAGALTQTAPSSGVSAEVGIAINATDLLIQVKAPVAL